MSAPHHTVRIPVPRSCKDGPCGHDHNVAVLRVSVPVACPECGKWRTGFRSLVLVYDPSAAPVTVETWSCQCGTWLYADVARQLGVGPTVRTTAYPDATHIPKEAPRP
jgi:hypothetical protein